MSWSNSASFSAVPLYSSGRSRSSPWLLPPVDQVGGWLVVVNDEGGLVEYPAQRLDRFHDLSETGNLAGQAGRHAHPGPKLEHEDPVPLVDRSLRVLGRIVCLRALESHYLCLSGLLLG